MELMLYYFFQCDIQNFSEKRNPNSSKIQSSRLHMMEFFEIEWQLKKDLIFNKII